MASCVVYSGMSILLFFVLSASASTRLCSDSNWFDASESVCKPCTTCGPKTLKVFPCTEDMDTMCVELSNLKFGDIKGSQSHTFHKWHEMEGDQEMAPDPEDKRIRKKISNSAIDDLQMKLSWTTVLVIVMLTALCAILAGLLIMLTRSSKMFSCCGNSKAAAARSRLFSRDRLNTTEYMHNLAGMDRKLAMDDLLEKKRRAVFEPQRLNDNLYVDDVFINLSGIPRFEDQADETTPDYSRSLLRLQDGQ